MAKKSYDKIGQKIVNILDKETKGWTSLEVVGLLEMIKHKFAIEEVVTQIGSELATEEETEEIEIPKGKNGKVICANDDNNSTYYR